MGLIRSHLALQLAESITFPDGLEQQPVFQDKHGVEHVIRLLDV